MESMLQRTRPVRWPCFVRICIASDGRKSHVPMPFRHFNGIVNADESPRLSASERYLLLVGPLVIILDPTRTNQKNIAQPEFSALPLGAL